MPPFQKNKICTGCPLEYAPSLCGKGRPDRELVLNNGIPLLILYTSPDLASIGKDFPFFSKAEHRISETLDLIWHEQGVRFLRDMPVRMEYAIPCGHVGKVPKGVDRYCLPHLHSRIEHLRPGIVLALGATATKMLGIKVQKFADIRGKPREVVLEGHRMIVVPSLEPYQLDSKPGLFRVFKQDLKHVCDMAKNVHQGGEIVVPTVENLTKNYKIPQTLEEVEQVCDEIIAFTAAGLKPEDWGIVFDIETTSLNTYDEKLFRIIAIAFGWRGGRAATIMLDHKKTPYDWKKAWQHVKRVLECPKPKIAHGGHFDIAGLELQYGARIVNLRWDTLMAEHILDEDKKGHYGLKVLTPTYAPDYAGYEDVLWDQLSEAAVKMQAAREHHAEEEIEEKLKTKRGIELANTPQKLVKKKRKKKEKTEAQKKKELRKLMKKGEVTFEDVDRDLLGSYAGLDADVTWKIYTAQNKIFPQESPKFYDLMFNHYIPGLRAISEIQYRGTKIDMDYLSRLEREMESELLELEEKMFSMVGRRFKINSKIQLEKIILYDLKLPPLEWTETGQLKVNKDVVKRYLSELEEGHPGLAFMRALKRYKTVHKGRTGFLKKVRALVDRNGVLHGHYHLNGTETGRLSSSEPNMQNWPKYIGRIVADDGSVVEPGYNVKNLVIPSSDDMVFFNVDYKGAEIRVFCAYTRDEVLIQALNDGLDVHSHITAKAAHQPYEVVQPPHGKRPDEYDRLRSQVKRVVFGTLYGGTVKTMSAILKIGIDEAQELVDMIFAAVPTLQEYIDTTELEVKTQGYVETFFGRRRRFRVDRHSKQSLRQAVNFKIQSTSSDITFGQLLEIHRRLPKELGGHVLGTVHDSIFGEVPSSELDNLHAFFKKWAQDRVAEKYSWMPVPFAYDLDVGPSYGELSKLPREKQA